MAPITAKMNDQPMKQTSMNMYNDADIANGFLSSPKKLLACSGNHLSLLPEKEVFCFNWHIILLCKVRIKNQTIVQK